MRPGKSLRSPRKNESARRDTRALQAGATELHRRPRTAARGGENGRTGWHWRLHGDTCRPSKGGRRGPHPRRFLLPIVGLEEFPNLLTPLGKKRDLATALEGGGTGQKVMSRQMFKIKQEIADHDRMALEVEWVGTLAVPLGSLPAGGQILLANGTGKWGF